MNRIFKMILVASGLLIISSSEPVMAAKQSHPLNIGYQPATGNMKISEFVKLTAKDISIISGRKLNLKEKISFSMMKRNMKHSVRKNGDQTVNEYIATIEKHDRGALIVLGILVLLAIIAFIVVSSM